MVDTNNINPHRVQMFSLQEIWNGIMQRLITLGVIKNPELESVRTESESSDLSEDFDFTHEGLRRVGTFF